MATFAGRAAWEGSEDCSNISETTPGISGGDQERSLQQSAKENTCSVCLELFTEPKVLPCCHIFCLQCLKKTATGGKVTCPKCRKVHGIPSSGLSALLTDFIVAHEVEATRLKKTKSQVCGECGQSGPISHFCSNCLKYLCRMCGLELHKRLKIYEGHKVYPIAEVDVATLQSSQVHYCAMHKGEVLKVYCENCEELICRDCTLVKHRHHNYKFVEEAREHVGKIMMALKSDVEKKFSVLKHNLQEIKKVEAAAVAHPHDVKADINAFFDHLVRSIEARRTTLLQQAEGACQKDLKQVWADKEYHEVEIGHISAVLSLVDKAVKCTSDSEMILTALQSITQLRIVKKREWDRCAFTNVVLSTPKFNSGEKPAVARVGGLDLAVVKSKGLQVVNQTKDANLKTDYILEVSGEQPIVDGRSGATISLKQTTLLPTLKVVVQYGRSQKKLDDAHISITPITCTKERTGSKYSLAYHSDPKYKVVIKLVCGGKHIVTFKCGKSTASHSFTVSGKPKNGAKMKKGPDWENKETFRSNPPTVTRDSKFVGSVDYEISSFGYYGHYGAGYQDMIPIRNNVNGQLSWYSWGQNGKYEVELA